MTYFSHSAPTGKGKERQGSKLLRDHVAGVAGKAGTAYFGGHGLPEGEALRELVARVCQVHDLGKYTPHFQHYLVGRSDFDQQLKQHAKFGAYALYEWYRSEGQEWLGLLGLYLVVHHHKSLTDLGALGRLVSTGEEHAEIFQRQLTSLDGELDAALRDGGMEALKPFVRFPEAKPLQRLLSNYCKRPVMPQNIRWYFLINYAFSLLIEADKLDASDTVSYQRQALPTEAVADRLGPAVWQEGVALTGLSQNELRTWVRGRVLRALDDPALATERLFTLTAPTGIGKTLTALDFALRLRGQLAVAEGYEPQIIYGLPFINIIEQAVAEYERTLGQKVLAHYQYADALEQLQERKRDDGQEENAAYNQKRMLIDTWQGDVVITSFVQLLQTLIGHRNKLLLKFHHLAGSIIVLDEVQTLRLGQLPLVGAVLYYLARYLNARVLIMTATRPLTFELAYQVILKAEGEPMPVVRELLPEYEAVFGTFQRTQLVSLLANPLADETAFIEQAFSQRWKTGQSALVVCNLVRRSVQVFEAVRDYLAKEKFDNPLYYLSTNVVPVARLKVIEQTKADLQAGRKPVLIATQVVEAGVDLDFDLGFRDLGPVDSLVQVAGRINRENSPARALAPLYVVEFSDGKKSDCEKIYDRITTEQSRRALDLLSAGGTRPIPEPEYLTLVGKYFEATAEANAFEEARKLFSGMKALNYDNREADTLPVSAFRIIDDKGLTVSVFVELDERGQEVQTLFTSYIRKQLSGGEWERHKRDFNQRIISVPGYLPRAEALRQSRDNVLCAGLLVINHRELSDYYDATTGFRRDAEPAGEHHVL